MVLNADMVYLGVCTELPEHFDGLQLGHRERVEKFNDVVIVGHTSVQVPRVKHAERPAQEIGLLGSTGDRLQQPRAPFVELNEQGGRQAGFADNVGDTRQGRAYRLRIVKRQEGQDETQKASGKRTVSDMFSNHRVS